MSIKVSVIVPAYNTENYISDCIESIIGQTLKDIEIIAVDDGSTDNTLKILKDFKAKNPEIIKVFHKNNGGQATARNLALEKAKGEYIAFVDSDDFLERTMLEEMYNKAIEDSADVVVCDILEHKDGKANYYTATDIGYKFSVTPSVCNKIFKNEIANSQKFPESIWYEDLEYTFKIFMKTDKISLVNKALYHTNLRDNSTMRNQNSEKNLDILTAFSHLEEGTDNNFHDTLEYVYIDHIFITAINRVAAQKTKEKGRVIKKLRLYGLSKYPKFYNNEHFNNMPIKRRIISVLNAYGFAFVSQFIFKFISLLKK